MVPTREPIQYVKDRNGALKRNSLTTGVNISAVNNWRSAAQFQIADSVFLGYTYGPVAVPVSQL